MYISRLVLTSEEYGVIRDISFHEGLNLIVDKTIVGDGLETGNNVGKTTVLRLIDYCLAGDAKGIYIDPESRGSTYRKVQDFLQEHGVLVTLELVDRLTSVCPRKVVIERDFNKGVRAIRRIDGEQVKAKEFGARLSEYLIPALSDVDKPTFRQTIAHNLRMDNWRLEHTVRLLDRNTTNVEYEALYLFLLGVPNVDAERKSKVIEKQSAERKFLERLENGRTLGGCRAALTQVNAEIDQIDKERASLSAVTDMTEKISALDGIRRRLAGVSSKIEQLDIRILMIRESLDELESSVAEIDIDALRLLYDEAKAYIPELQRSFEDLVIYHNAMIEERAKFISKELPSLESERDALQVDLDGLMKRERSLSHELSVVLASDQAESLLARLNEKHRQVGELESLIAQMEESQSVIASCQSEIDAMAMELYSSEFQARIQEKLGAFNQQFSYISKELYGDTYVMSCDLNTDRYGNVYYGFSVQGLNNVSAGKKQGEILCFDMAYTRYADAEGLDCLHFLLNDKKELMHGNQLVRFDEIARESNVQMIVSMLEDKLPAALQREQYVVLELSQDSKLFRIEELEQRSLDERK